MSKDNKNDKNPYHNDVALKDVIKMMKRKDKITVSFIVDEYGFSCGELDSKKLTDKLILQMSEYSFAWLHHYLEKGEIKEPIPSPYDNLLINENADTHDLVEVTINNFLMNNFDLHRIQVVPEIIDKPDRLTIIYTYPYGCIVLRTHRTEELEVLLESKFNVNLKNEN